MSTSERRLPFTSLLIFIFGAAAFLTPPSTSPLDTLIFSNCTEQKYTPSSPFNSNIILLFSRLVASAASAAFGNFTVPASAPQDTTYGLYQCRGDLNPVDCYQCVAAAVSRVRTICSVAYGGALQMEGCFVKYHNESFFGVEDKTVVVTKCGSSIGSDLQALSGLSVSLLNLISSGGTYRTSGVGDVRTVAQCVGDLGVTQCQDCISDAIVRLKSACGPFNWGDLFLAKCYARFAIGAMHAQDNGNGYGYYQNVNQNSEDNVNETPNNRLTMIVGVITAVSSLAAILIALYNKISENG